jgi:hypothetical protein
MSYAGSLSLACLMITCALSTWAIFSHHFDDTLIQRAGLAVVATGTASRTVERLTETVPDPPPALLWSQVGLALYAIGTAIRLYRAAKKAGPNRRRGDGRRGLSILRE